MLIKDNIAFIHPYKTGGTSVNTYLFNHGFKRTGKKHDQARVHDLNGCYVISMIRPPHDRMVSMYCYCRGIKPLAVSILKNHSIKQARFLFDVNRISFTEFVIKYSHILGKQSGYYIDANGEQVIDYMIRLPHINEDFDRLCDIINIPKGTLPHKHKTSHRTNIGSYYTTETWDLVNKNYIDDIAIYDKWNKWHENF